MPIRAILGLMLLALPSSVLADPIPASCPESAKKLTASDGEAFLRKVQETYAGVQTLTADFEQHSTLAALESEETSSGGMYFERPGKMRWHYAKPEEQLFTLKDGALWLYNPADKSVVIERVAAAFISDLPVAFLMGVGDLARDFDLTTACTTDREVVLQLAPRKSGAAVRRDEQLQSFVLVAGRDDFLPHGARVLDVSGNITSIRLSRLARNRPLPGDAFSTAVPPGTDVNDRRISG